MVLLKSEGRLSQKVSSLLVYLSPVYVFQTIYICEKLSRRLSSSRRSCSGNLPNCLWKSAQLIESQNRPGWLTNTLKYIIYNTRRSQAKFSNLLMIITTEAEMSPEISEDNTELAMYCTSILGKEDFELIKHIIIENKNHDRSLK